MDNPTDTEMPRALGEALERMVAAYQRALSSLPTFEARPEISEFIWRGPVDEDECAPWAPVRKDVLHDLSALCPDLGELHPSVHAYFNSWWFCDLSGTFGDVGLSLESVPPGLELQSFVRHARNYRESHPELRCVPIGIGSPDDFSVMVSNDDGSVALHDWERGVLIPVAGSLVEVLDGMRWA